MINRLFIFSTICFFTLSSFLLSQYNELDIISINNISYIALDSFIEELNLKSKFFDDNKKVILYHQKNRVVLSEGCSYFLINDEIFHLYTHAIYDGDDFYIPAKSFISHLKNQKIFNNINLDSSEKLVIIDTPKHNISSYNVSEKGNGFSITIKTSNFFNEALLAT